MKGAIFCKHDYAVVSQVETKSEAEQLHDMGLRPNTHSSFVKKYATIMKCAKCGNIKKFVIKA